MVSTLQMSAFTNEKVLVDILSIIMLVSRYGMQRYNYKDNFLRQSCVHTRRHYFQNYGQKVLQTYIATLDLNSVFDILVVNYWFKQSLNITWWEDERSYIK